MAPKQLNGKGGRNAEPSFARSAVQGLTSAENRSIVTSIGLFAVSLPCIQSEDDESNMRTAEPMNANAPVAHIRSRQRIMAAAQRWIPESKC